MATISAEEFLEPEPTPDNWDHHSMTEATMGDEEFWGPVPRVSYEGWGSSFSSWDEYREWSAVDLLEPIWILYREWDMYWLEMRTATFDDEDTSGPAPTEEYLNGGTDFGSWAAFREWKKEWKKCRKLSGE